MSLFDLSGRVAVITGSSRGIGRATAERLAEQGANLVISSRKLGASQAVADGTDAGSIELARSVGPLRLTRFVNEPGPPGHL